MSYTVNESTYFDLARKLAILSDLISGLNNAMSDLIDLADCHDRLKMYHLIDNYHDAQAVSSTMIYLIEELSQQVESLDRQQALKAVSDD